MTATALVCSVLPMATDTNPTRFAPIAGNFYTSGDDAGRAFKYGVTFGTLAGTTWLTPTAPLAVAELLKTTMDAQYTEVPAHQRPTTKIVTMPL